MVWGWSLLSGASSRELLLQRRMSGIPETETVFVKEECTSPDIKEEYFDESYVKGIFFSCNLINQYPDTNKAQFFALL